MGVASGLPTHPRVPPKEARASGSTSLTRGIPARALPGSGTRETNVPQFLRHLSPPDVHSRSGGVGRCSVEAQDSVRQLCVIIITLFCLHCYELNWSCYFLNNIIVVVVALLWCIIITGKKASVFLCGHLGLEVLVALYLGQNVNSKSINSKAGGMRFAFICIFAHSLHIFSIFQKIRKCAGFQFFSAHLLLFGIFF